MQGKVLKGSFESPVKEKRIWYLFFFFSEISLEYIFVSVTITDKNSKEIFSANHNHVCIYFLIFFNLKFCLLASLLMLRFRHVLRNVPFSLPLDAPRAKDADTPPPSQTP